MGSASFETLNYCGKQLSTIDQSVRRSRNLPIRGSNTEQNRVSN